jgi:hypothetical protein
MPLRPLLTAVCLAALACAAPRAWAHDGEAPGAPAEAAPGDLARKLADPGNQIAATVALTALAETLLDTRVEPARQALAMAGDPRAADLPRDARLRDLLGPKAETLPGRIGRTVPRTMGAAAGMVDGLQAMLPELKAELRRMKAALPHQ